MRIENRYGLPQAFVDAVSEQREHKPGFISVTEMISPPQQRALILRYGDELTEEASDQVQRFFGTAAHERLAKFAHNEYEMRYIEERFEMPCLGWTVHGTLDLYGFNTRQITDWKTTTVRSLRYDRPEWEAQLNLYAHLLGFCGHEPQELVVVVLLRDWESFMLADDSYPRQPIVQVPVRLWDAYEAQRFMENRVALHQRAAESGTWDRCTDEERWMRGVWTVTKKGNSRATKTFETEEEATLYAQNRLDPIQDAADWFDVDYRPGKPLRCLSYCVAASICQQHADWRAEQPQEAAVVFDG